MIGPFSDGLFLCLRFISAIACGPGRLIALIDNGELSCNGIVLQSIESDRIGAKRGLSTNDTGKTECSAPLWAVSPVDRFRLIVSGRSFQVDRLKSVTKACICCGLI